MGEHFFSVEVARDFLKLRGPDAASWLQGLISNDVDKLAMDQSIHAALLTAQGKFLFHMFLYKLEDGLLLETGREQGPALQQRLMMYKLRADVDISNVSDEFQIHLLWGSGDYAALNLEPRAGHSAQADDRIIAVDPRHASLGLRMIAKSGLSPFDLLSTKTGTYDAYREHQALLGIFDPDLDLIPQKTTLLEANFDYLEGVDFDKGCYVGQELTARMHHRSLARKRQLPVRFDANIPDAGAKIRSGDFEIGELLSVQRTSGMALIRLDRMTKAMEGSDLGFEADGCPIQIITPDFMAELES